jgi:hypothetical protein
MLPLLVVDDVHLTGIKDGHFFRAALVHSHLPCFFFFATSSEGFATDSLNSKAGSVRMIRQDCEPHLNVLFSFAPFLGFSSLTPHISIY